MVAGGNVRRDQPGRAAMVELQRLGSLVRPRFRWGT